MTALPVLTEKGLGPSTLGPCRVAPSEGRTPQSIVRRGSNNTVCCRRAMIILALSSGNMVPAISRLVQADKDTVCEVIHPCNEMGLDSQNPNWARGRLRLLTWSFCKLADHTADDSAPWALTPARARAGPAGVPTASPTSTAATQWVMRPCGASSTAARVR